MGYHLVVIFSFSILIAAIAAIIKIRHIASSYYPFVACTCIAAINEVISYCMDKWFHGNNVNNNIYVLIEFLLISRQFYKWDIFAGRKILYYSLSISAIIFWSCEYHSFKNLHAVHLYYRLFASFVIVLLSVSLNSRLIINHQKRLIKNPIFLICSGYILFFTFEIFIETFWVYGLRVDPALQTNIFQILIWINLFVNLLYVIAVICIPPKPQFIPLF